VTFCEIFPPDNFPIYFYRCPKAPDLEIRAEDLDYAPLEARVAVGNLEECETATGERDPVRAGQALLGLGVDLAVVK